MRWFDRRRFLAALGGAAAVSAAPRKIRSLLPQIAPDLARIAHDPDRPSFHLLPPHNWMNDPNGPIWWRGEYHLFYQLNPHAAVWDEMNWGHAVSPDMIHWRHQPVALAPTPGGPDSEGCFSGSSIVFKGVPTILYTGVQNAPPDQVTLHDGSDKLRETQLVAAAEDPGLLHWRKDAQPVIAAPPPGMRVTGFRDPCPWREHDGWYLGVGSGERGVGGCVLLYRSLDLRHWTFLGKLAQGKPNGLHTPNPCDSGEMWECPDFFPLHKHHCLLYSTEGKVVWTTGSYDQRIHAYTSERTGVLDRGAYYAPKSFPAPDGRRILWGWIQETRPQAEYAAAGWAGCMSLPRVLQVGDPGQLIMDPAHEVERLRGPGEHLLVASASPFRRKLAELRCELQLRMSLFETRTVAVRLNQAGEPAWELAIDIPANEIRCGSVRFPLPGMPWPRPGLRLFLDGSVIESFISSREALTSRVYGLKPGETELEVTLTGRGQTELQFWPLQQISSDRLTT
jgi:beta-fructofuranosidase